MRHLPHALGWTLAAALLTACQPTDVERRAVAASAAAEVAAAPRASEPAPPDRVRDDEARPSAETPARARWLAPREALVRGERALLGVRFVLAEGWHVYWPGQNDSGAPPRIVPRLPEGLVAEAPLWPPPTRHVAPGDLLDHVLEDVATLLVPVRVADDAPLGPITLRAQVECFVCRDVCLRASFAIELPLQVVEAGAAPGSRASDAELLALAERRLPRDEAPPGLTLRREGETLQLHVPGASALAFFPAADGLPLADVLASCAARADTLTLRPDPLLPGGDRLRGVLEVRAPDLPPRAYSLDLPPP